MDKASEGPAMSLEQSIRESDWWRAAQDMPDRHYDPSEGVSLADHLEAVHRNLGFLTQPGNYHEYFGQLVSALGALGQDPVTYSRLLRPVALLHDIGKVREDKKADGEHPLTGKSVKLRHPVVSLAAGVELLPEDASNRATILALIEEHDTPFSWFVNFQNSGQAPKRKSWAKLDRSIDPREDGTGILLLAAFKLADIDGHESVDDVTWFFECANSTYLVEKGKWLPVPDESAIRSLER
jgi:hypothetical protein